MVLVAARSAWNGRSRASQATVTPAPTMITTTAHMPISEPISRSWASVNRPVMASSWPVMLLCRLALARSTATA